jgi:Uncharacterised nucleotidyltransferase
VSSESLASVAWLLGTCTVQDQPVATPQTCELAYALARRSWRVLPVLAPRIMAWTGTALPMVLQHRLIGLQRICAIREAWLKEYVRRMDAQGIPYALIKGAACGVLGYERLSDRASFDIDVAVLKPFVRVAESIAESCGFDPAQWNDDARVFHSPNMMLRAMTEAQHFELGYLVRRQLLCERSDPDHAMLAEQCTPDQLALHMTPEGDIAIYLGLDIHHGLALDIPADDFVNHAVTRQLPDGGSVRVISPAGAIFHAILKIYLEGAAWGEGLHHYADCIRIIQRSDADTAEALWQLVETHRFHAGAHYVLRRLPTAFSVPLPPGFARIVESCSATAAGFPDMWDRLLDIRSRD